MKRIIKSNTNIKKYDLYIEVEYTNLTPDIEITSDTSVEGVPFDVKGSWDAFLVNIENVLRKNKFEIVESHESNRPESLSQYYAIYPADSDNRVKYEIMIVLRVSDHYLPRGVDNDNSYYEKYAQEHKVPENKSYQEWEFEQVTVNGQYSNSYVRAIRQIKQLVQSWKDAVTY